MASAAPVEDSAIAVIVPATVAPDPVPLIPLTIFANAITCDTESNLPNWGDKGPAITAITAASYITSHPGCQPVSGWSFQWGLGSGSSDQTALDPGGSTIGPAGGAEADAWHTFGPTDSTGVTSVTVADLKGASDIWVRENLQAGYIGFSEPPILSSPNKNPVSAETYCSSDVINYDNYDAVYSAILGNTYYCVTFNVLASTIPVTSPDSPSVTHENTPPVITILGDNPANIIIGNDYIDAGATATDTEDGSITTKIIATSTVSTTTVGAYTVIYAVKDSGGLTSTSTRIVNIAAATIDTVAPVTNGSGGGGNPGGASIGFGGWGVPLLATANAASPAVAFTTSSNTTECVLLYSYLRYGYANDPTEVVKLQAFMSRIEGYDVDVNGTFDQKTLSAVNAFQTKYLLSVMGPWGASQSSGYVYITTKKKVNQIACDIAFVINKDEQSIINAYKTAQAENVTPVIPNDSNNNGNATTSPDIGVTKAIPIANAATIDNPNKDLNSAGVGNSSFAVRSWNYIISLFYPKK